MDLLEWTTPLGVERGDGIGLAYVRNLTGNKRQTRKQEKETPPKAPAWPTASGLPRTDLFLHNSPSTGELFNQAPPARSGHLAKESILLYRPEGKI